MRSDPARIEAELAPFGEPGAQSPVETSLGPGESIADVVANKDGKSRKGEMPVNYAKVDLVAGRLILLAAHPSLTSPHGARRPLAGDELRRKGVPVRQTGRASLLVDLADRAQRPV